MQTPSLLMNSVSPCDVKRSIFAQQKDLHASRDAYVYVNISVFSTEAYEYSATAYTQLFVSTRILFSLLLSNILYSALQYTVT